jgi:regulator of sigma E protease
MEALISILTSTFWVLLAFTVLVFVHELGHFLTAKYFGMRVERFSIGFPPTVYGRRHGDTEYAVGATPLGGYVKISGMIDESMDTDHIESDPEPWEFRAKPVWQRIVVISAGVVFNAILALLIFGGLRWAEGETYIPAQNVDQVYVQDGSVAYEVGLRTGDKIIAVNGTPFDRFDQMNPSAMVTADSLTVTVKRDGRRTTLVGPSDIITRLSRAQSNDQGFGMSFLPPLIGGVQKGSPADSLGMQAMDRILSINGDTVRFWQEMSAFISDADGTPMTVRWLRPDSLVADSLVGGTTERGAVLVRRGSQGTVMKGTVSARFNEEEGRYMMGVANPMSTQAPRQAIYSEYGVETRTFGPVGALREGATSIWSFSANIVVTLKRVITGRDSLRQSLGGPVMIAQVTSEAASRGPAYFWRLVAILSITLAIMNTLPIPALDGGQLMFLLYEAVTRRKPSVRVRLVAQQVGMILLLGFMAFLIFNDLLRL